MAANFQHSPLGKLELHQESLNQILYLEPGTLDLTTTSIASNLQIFEELWGPDVPLMITLSYTDMKFKFGPSTDLDVQVDYKLNMRVAAKYGADTDQYYTDKYFYDEIPMQIGLNVELHDDTIKGEIKSM